MSTGIIALACIVATIVAIALLVTNPPSDRNLVPALICLFVAALFWAAWFDAIHA